MGRTRPMCLSGLQPTLLREERPTLSGQPSRRLHCNPRSCARSDDSILIKEGDPDIATHAPARGATTCIL